MILAEIALLIERNAESNSMGRPEFQHQPERYFAMWNYFHISPISNSYLRKNKNCQ